MTVVVIVELHNCDCKIGLERLALLMTSAFSVQPAAEDVDLADVRCTKPDDQRTTIELPI